MKNTIVPSLFHHLYVHVPFCAGKCDYCAFYSVANAPEEVRGRYLQALERDLAEAARNAGLLKSVYIGGGTPTFLEAESLFTLRDMIRQRFQFDAHVEVSMECNPESLTPKKADVLATFVNRVSIGVQSFNPVLRSILGRRGEGRRVHDAVRLLSERRLDNLGADLIYAIPGQTVDMWRDDLKRAVDLGVTHISTYSLSIDEGAKLAERGDFPLIDDDAAADMWNVADEILEEGGFRRYEISNFAKPGRECVHNTGIWLGDAYAGVGPAATSFNGVDRWTNGDLDHWLDGTPPVIDEIAPERRHREVFVMGLRLAEGWNRATFQRRVRANWDEWRNELNPLIDSGLLIETENAIRPTSKGMLFWDDVAETSL